MAKEKPATQADRDASLALRECVDQLTQTDAKIEAAKKRLDRLTARREELASVVANARQAAADEIKEAEKLLGE